METICENSAKKFSVVNFLEDNAVEAVPSSWICKSGKTCYWPRKKPENFLDLLKDPEREPLRTWKTWNIDIIKSYDDYDRASKKATAFVKTSSVETGDEKATFKRKRTSKHATEINYQPPPESTILSVITENQNRLGSQPNSLNPSPRLATQINDLSQESTTSYGISSISNDTNPTYRPTLVSNEQYLATSEPNRRLDVPAAEHQSQPSITSSHTPLGFTPNPFAAVNSKGIRPTSLFPNFSSTALPAFNSGASHHQSGQQLNARIPLTTYSNPPIHRLNDEVQSLRQEFRNFQLASLNGQEELKAQLKELRSLLASALATLGKDSDDCSVLSKFPIQTERDFCELEVELKVGTNFQDTVKYLSRIGGDTVAKNVYNVLRCVIGKQLSQELRYTPKSGKTAFGNSLLAKAVREAIIQTPGSKESTVDSINTYIGRWFRNIISQSSKKLNGAVKTNQAETNSQSSPRNTGTDTIANTGPPDSSGTDHDD